MKEIRLISNDDELNDVLEIRKKVFVDGQKVTIERERDGLDKKAEHVIFYYNKKAVGTARIRYVDNKMKLERIAIIEEMRGKGLGKDLMKFLTNYGRAKKVKGIKMEAQAYLEKFYTEFGFKKTERAPFKDAGIDHIEMYLNL